MKMKKGDMVIECIELVQNVWAREGFVPFDEEPKEITYQEMKRIAKENGINSHGMSKEVLLDSIKEYI
jgi:hypothetical protein